MTSKYDSDNTTRTNDRPEQQRYAAFQDGAGDITIYDTEEGNAWIQSDTAVEIASIA
jgi:hypothetical protein